MRLIMLTHTSVKNYFDSIVLDGNGSDFDVDTRRLLDDIISDITSFTQSDPHNQLSPYLTFVYMMLNLHSSIYVKANSESSAITTEHLNRLLSILTNLAPGITSDNILVADKMDILYGTQHLTYSEQSKFSVWFYEQAYEIAVNTINPERIDDVYNEAIVYIETIISNIEQNVIFLGQEINPDDVVVLCLYPVNGALFFLID